MRSQYFGDYLSLPPPCEVAFRSAILHAHFLAIRPARWGVRVMHSKKSGNNEGTYFLTPFWHFFAILASTTYLGCNSEAAQYHGLLL